MVSKVTTFVMFLVAVSMLFVAVPRASADGAIIPDRAEAPPLTVVYHRVDVEIVDQVATTKIDQVFRNESDGQLEGTYIFPLPSDAAISGFSMLVDGRKVEGQLLDRDEARRIYESIVSSRRDPALLEYLGQGAFRASIFPIPPRGERRVQLQYTQVLRRDGDVVRYLYPLSTEKFSSRPLEQVSVHIRVRSREPIKSVLSPSHPSQVSRPDDYTADVSYEESGVKPERDFALLYTLSADSIGASLLSYRPQGEDGYFLLLVAPQLRSQQQVVQRDIIFVLDTSGSMRGGKIEQAKEALQFVLDNLNEGDRFNIVAFSSTVNPFSDRVNGLGERRAAKQFVDDLQAVGGTNIHDALLTALRTVERTRPTMLVFLTDGLPTVGETETERILGEVEDATPSNTRIFTFGVGDDVNTLLLDGLAAGHGGASAYVRPGESLEDAVSTFYTKIGAPILADLRLDFGGAQVSDIFPAALPDLFRGSQLVVAGRYRKGGTQTITLTGNVNGAEQRFVYRGQQFSAAAASSNEFLPRLWATRKVAHLLNQIRLHGENAEVVDEIVELSVRHGIITPYTSFLVQEDSDVLSREGRREMQATVADAATAAPSAGAQAVDNAQTLNKMATESAPAAPGVSQVKQVGEKSFFLRDGIWFDTAYETGRRTTKLAFGSKEYYDVLRKHAEWGRYLALSDRVVVVLQGQAYEVTRSGDAPIYPLP